MASNSDDSNDYNDLEVAAVLANVSNSNGLRQNTRSLSLSNSVVDYSPFTISTLTNAVRGNVSAEPIFETISNLTIHQLAGQGELLGVQQVFSEDSVNAIDEHGKTPLMSAVGAGWCHVVLFFLEHGADPNILDRRSTTSLMQACCLGHRSIVNALLDHDADVNMADSNGNTALHYAVFGNHHECVQVLVVCGADLMAANSESLTPLELASKLGFKDVQDVIYAHLLQALAE